MSEPLIRVRNLTRDYRLMDKREGVMGGFVDLLRPRWRTLRAVADVSFDIAPGEMVGYIGANGAGKSTTIKMLTGILTPTGGEVYIEGVRPDVMRMFRQYGFDRLIGPDKILETHDTVGHMFHKVMHPGFCIYNCKERVFAECQALPKDDHAANLPEISEIHEISDHKVEELKPTVLKLLMEDPTTELVVIDVSEPGEFKNWHLHGARLLPLRKLTTEGRELLGKETVVFVSRIGRRSALAVHIMQDLGHRKAFNLQGGMLAWEAAGFPIAVE